MHIMHICFLCQAGIMEWHFHFQAMKISTGVVHLSLVATGTRSKIDTQITPKSPFDPTPICFSIQAMNYLPALSKPSIPL